LNEFKNEQTNLKLAEEKLAAALLIESDGVMCTKFSLRNLGGVIGADLIYRLTCVPEQANARLLLAMAVSLWGWSCGKNLRGKLNEIRLHERPAGVYLAGWARSSVDGCFVFLRFVSADI